MWKLVDGMLATDRRQGLPLQRPRRRGRWRAEHRRQGRRAGTREGDREGAERPTTRAAVHAPWNSRGATVDSIRHRAGGDKRRGLLRCDVDERARRRADVLPCEVEARASLYESMRLQKAGQDHRDSLTSQWLSRRAPGGRNRDWPATWTLAALVDPNRAQLHLCRHRFTKPVAE